MLFETQAKADNFIKYNSEGILEENGKAPVRSYYCEMCGGYHVTSNPSEEVGERLNQRDHLRIESLTAYKREIEEIKTLSNLLSQRLVNIKALLFFGEIRITPSKINVLKENEIFVFGSNIKGLHMGGAARAAYNKFGAEWGNGEGLQGSSYASPNMDGIDGTK